MLGYWASFLWVVTPFASIPLFVDRYQERWTEHFLPQALGLTSLSDFPSMVAVLAAALFVVRSLDASRVAEAASRSSPGAAGGMKPPNLLMGVGAALAYLVARRWRDGIVFEPPSSPASCSHSGRSAGWASFRCSRRGCGRRRFLSRSTSTATSVSTSTTGACRWTSCASSSGARGSLSGRRSRACSPSFVSAAASIAALLGGWLAAFLLVKGFSTRADIQANTFWRR